LSTPVLDLQHFDSLVLVTGISGAGKSTAMHLLSDSGYYVVDNLPLPLLRDFLAFSAGAGVRFLRTALLLDIDSEESQKIISSILGAPSTRSSKVQLIFLDANTRAVLRRYSETRRPHPGFDPKVDPSLESAIQRERDKLQPVKEIANLVLDTSDFTVHSLKRELREFLLSLNAITTQQMRVNFLSFGFKHGVPADCDLIADVRFLKNPFYVESLREKTGLDTDVRDYVFTSPDASDFVKRYSELLAFLLPRYHAEGKAYINIGVGCSGGKHRSVAIAQALVSTIDPGPFLLSVRHRDL
jgi:UPF0042 nucleotide-binding protein